MQLKEHPSVKRWQERAAVAARPAGSVDMETLRRACLHAGADDVGFVDIDRPEVADQRQLILDVFPRARTLVSFVLRMNPEAIRSTARSVANLEFHHTGEAVNEVGRRIVGILGAHGWRGLNPAMGFPMEMDRYPSRIQVISHKPIAVAAGLGVMGIHRNVIHPVFGSFVLLGTVITDAPIGGQSPRLDYSPCIECKLCVATCPTGAIKPDGAFDFSACLTHNYREFLGGFTDFMETVVEAKDRHAYRRAVSDSESVSWWQSLSFGPNYKAAYCLAVCPAGDDVIAPFLQERQEFVEQIARPLQEKVETVYVMAGTDAEEHVAKRFPAKRTKRVGQVLRPVSVETFLFGMRLSFQRGKAKGLDARYHFTFTGDAGRDGPEVRRATVTIRDQELRVVDGLEGGADVRISADASTWIGFLRGEKSLPWALVRRRIRVRGSLALFRAFARCFPANR